MGFLQVPYPPDGDLGGVQGDPLAGGELEQQHLVRPVVVPAAQFGVQVGKNRGNVSLESGDGVEDFLAGGHFGAKDFKSVDLAQ